LAFAAIRRADAFAPVGSEASEVRRLSRVGRVAWGVCVAMVLIRGW